MDCLVYRNISLYFGHTVYVYFFNILTINSCYFSKSSYAQPTFPPAFDPPKLCPLLVRVFKDM